MKEKSTQLNDSELEKRFKMFEKKYNELKSYNEHLKDVLNQLLKENEELEKRIREFE